MNSRRARRAKKRSNKITCFIAMMLVVVACFYLYGETKGLKSQSATLTADEQHLQNEYQKELERKENLEQEKVYVQTKQYIEESAKKLGYVYPNEIVFKPAN